MAATAATSDDDIPIEVKTLYEKIERELEESVYQELHQHRNQQATEELRLVAVGLTGSGKSSFCNHLTIKDNQPPLFPSIGGPESITKECKQLSFETVGDRQVSVVDTPGFFDTDNGSKMLKEIVKCVFLTAPGPHAFLFLIRADQRFTEQIPQAIRDCLDMFGDQTRRHMIFVLTGKDWLDQNGLTERSERKLREKLEAVVGKQDLRYTFINNSVAPESQENRDQMEQLFQKMEEMIHFNQNPYYTSELMLKAEEVIEKRERAASLAAARRVGLNIKKVWAEYKGKIDQAEGEAKRLLWKSQLEEMKAVIEETRRSSRVTTLDVRDEMQKEKGWLMPLINHKLLRCGLSMTLKGIAGLIPAMDGLAIAEFPIQETGEMNVFGQEHDVEGAAAADDADQV